MIPPQTPPPSPDTDAHTSPALPWTTDEAPIQARFRAQDEDFLVHELPAYLPSGAGDHLFVHFEKRGLTTREAVRRLAAALGADPRAAGYAGLKDRHAITTQWASFEKADPAKLADLAIEGVRVLESARHQNKLRTGHLHGNRFVLRLRDVPADRVADVRRILDLLAARGVPNYFGEQRFGHGGRNLELALAWIARGGRAPREPFQRKLLVSVLQSALFNEVLAERIRDGLFAKAVEGDLLRKEDTGGLFTTPSLDEAERRVADWSVSPTGPMFGAKMRNPEAEALAREARVLARRNLEASHFEAVKRFGEGTRRPLRIRPTELAVKEDPEGLVISLCLPKGAYATVVVGELLKRDIPAGWE